MRMAKATDYVDNGDGTVTDTRSGLMWKQCLEGQSGADCEGTAGLFNWDDAMKTPQTVNHGRFRVAVASSQNICLTPDP